MSGRLRTTLRALLAPALCIAFGMTATVVAVSMTADASRARRTDIARRGLAGCVEELSARLAVLDGTRIELDARLWERLTLSDAAPAEGGLVVVADPTPNSPDADASIALARPTGTAPDALLVADEVLEDLPTAPDTWAALAFEGRRVLDAPGTGPGFVTVARRPIPGRPGWTLDAVATTGYFADPTPVVAAGIGTTATMLIATACGVWALQVRRRLDVEARLRDSVRAALHDVLTGLPNRAQLMEWMPRELALCSAGRPALGVMFLDVDRFKTVNDTLGHAAGDDLLREVANRLAGAVRHGDLVVRLAGDEFVIAAPGVGSRAALSEMAERVLAAFDTPVSLRTGPFLTGLSIGLTVVDGASDTPLDAVGVLEQADAAMYIAKGSPGRRFAFFDEALQAASDDRVSTGDALRDGLGRGEVVAHFQPVVVVATGEVIAVEAFVRWNRPGHGLLAPGAFLDAAERRGLMGAVGRLVLREAAHQAARWNIAGTRRTPLPVTVNVSERQLLAPDFVDTVTEVLDEVGIPPSWLHLELTEAIALDRRVQQADVLERLAALGIPLVIDDFGLRHGSLRLLQHLRVGMVKVAPAAVHRITENAGDAAIVAAVVPVAHALGARAVAAGVETPTQLRMLTRAGFGAVQGHLVLQPVPADDLDPSRPLRAIGDLGARR